MQFFNPQQILASARCALQSALMLTMGGAAQGAVVLYGLFGAGLHDPRAGVQ